MKSYRVSFINELPNDTGHVFQCCQRVIDITAAKSRHRAVAAAKLRFARSEGIRDWHLRAQSLKVDELG